MSKHVKHVPKHRGPVSRPAVVEAPRKALRNTVILSTVAVAATGVTVGSALIGQAPAVSADSDDARTASAAQAAGTLSSLSQRGLGDRDAAVSRSASRPRSADPAKAASLLQADSPAMTRTEDLSDEDPRDIGRALLAEFGFSSDQFGCLDSLWTRESNWTWNADNPTSSAYGIPQALPGSKMASAGADWATNPVTQIRWGLGYIQDRYGSPCGAWSFSEGHGFY